MKTSGLWLALSLCITAQARQSELLFPSAGARFEGVPGNLLFDGAHFVTVMRDSNALLRLQWVDTNGASVTATSLHVHGTSARVALVENGILVTWLTTNSPKVLQAARFAQNQLGPVTAVATNVAEDSCALSAASNSTIAVWQTAGAIGVVLGCALNADGSVAGSAFAISPSPQAQRFPSVASDGTEHLVVWMEQSTVVECDGSNGWRVAARRLVNGLPTSASFTVSQTNSVYPHPTACVFGTNYLVLWSSDRRWVTPDGCTLMEATPALHQRSVSTEPVGHEQIVMASPLWSSQGTDLTANTRPAAAFDGEQFLVTCLPGNVMLYPRLQPIAADGTRRYYPFDSARVLGTRVSQLSSGAGIFIALHSDHARTVAVVLRQIPLPELNILGIRRSNSGIGFQKAAGPFQVEVSTDLTNWVLYPSTGELPPFAAHMKLFAREASHQLPCIENLRTMDWGKHVWAFNHRRQIYDIPAWADLSIRPFPMFFPMLPRCPASGTYTLNGMSTKPTCTISGHTL
jgi:hypothetical protein